MQSGFNNVQLGSSATFTGENLGGIQEGSSFNAFTISANSISVNNLIVNNDASASNFVATGAVSGSTGTFSGNVTSLNLNATSTVTAPEIDCTNLTTTGQVKINSTLDINTLNLNQGSLVAEGGMVVKKSLYTGGSGFFWKFGNHEIEYTTPGSHTGIIFNKSGTGDRTRFNMVNTSDVTPENRRFEMGYNSAEYTAILANGDITPGNNLIMKANKVVNGNVNGNLTKPWTRAESLNVARYADGSEPNSLDGQLYAKYTDTDDLAVNTSAILPNIYAPNNGGGTNSSVNFTNTATTFKTEPVVVETALTCQNGLTVSSGGIAATGNSTITGGLTVTLNTAVNGTLTVLGTTSFNDNVSVSGDISCFGLIFNDAAMNPMNLSTVYNRGTISATANTWYTIYDCNFDPFVGEVFIFIDNAYRHVSYCHGITSTIGPFITTLATHTSSGNVEIQESSGEMQIRSTTTTDLKWIYKNYYF